jgi:hypothetical protein
MSNNYVILTNSNSSLAKRFRVLADGYRPQLEKTGVRRTTVTGKLDNQVGPILRSWQLVIRVYDTDPAGSDYGTLANLKTFFGYNDPSGTPSNVITFTDFDESEYEVYLLGKLSEQNLTPIIEGSCAMFHVPVELMETEPS